MSMTTTLPAAVPALRASCAALKTSRFKDDIYELLEKVRNSDGFVMASPVYFCDISGQLHCFLERLIYQVLCQKSCQLAAFVQ
jgi:multimeric flavodoxin WrbA